MKCRTLIDDFDTQLTGNMSAGLDSIEALKDDCEVEAESDTDVWTTGGATFKPPTAILDLTCNDECKINGKCQEGTNICLFILPQQDLACFIKQEFSVF